MGEDADPGLMPPYAASFRLLSFPSSASLTLIGGVASEADVIELDELIVLSSFDWVYFLPSGILSRA